MLGSDIIRDRRSANCFVGSKICFLTPVHWTEAMGGAEYQMKLLIDYLVERRLFNISYLARTASIDVPPEPYTICNVQNRITPRSTYLLDGRSIWKTLTRIRPHLIYQRVGCAYTGIAAYFGRRYNVPTLWHAASEMDFTSPTPAGKSAIPGINKLERKILNYGIRNSSLVVTQTTDQAKLLKKHFDRTADCVVANFHPAPDEAIRKADLPITVVWIGNLKPGKRPELFMRLARDFRNNESVRFKMIGAQPVSLPYDAEINETRASNRNFQYLGRCTQSEVNSLLADSHILVSTSRQEGFPNTFIQAWMRNVPVVSLDVDPDEVISRKGLGEVCSSYDYLRRAVESLVNDVDRRTSQGSNASRYAMSKHSMANASQIEALMLDAIHNAPTPKYSQSSTQAAVRQ